MNPFQYSSIGGDASSRVSHDNRVRRINSLSLLSLLSLLRLLLNRSIFTVDCIDACSLPAAMGGASAAAVVQRINRALIELGDGAARQPDRVWQ